MDVRAVLLGAFVALGVVAPLSGALAENPDQDPHPIVGTWRVSFREGLAGSPGGLASFFIDGNVILTDDAGRTWHGVWSGTGARKARFAIVAPQVSGIPSGGITYITPVDVHVDGMSFVRSSTASSDQDTIVGARIRSGA
ncbi:MAG: hypothetical protein KJZ78_21700 [Bryobacteraceae bacterium]|nr:hypothetical protein [Bryobacteraceae bacterium]